MLVYDIEIVRAIPPKDGVPLVGVEYCEGWDDHANMGIAVICAYDYHTGRYRVFTEGNFGEFQELVDNPRTHPVVGFNSIKFDDAVCAAHNLCISTDYDLLVEMWKAAGLGPVFQYPTHTGFGLDATAAANFGKHKTGNGALAPVHWQQGKYGTVIDYCLEDVRLTKMLLDKVLFEGYITDPRNLSRYLPMMRPAVRDMVVAPIHESVDQVYESQSHRR